MTIAIYGMSIPLLAVLWGRGKPLSVYRDDALFRKNSKKLKYFVPGLSKKYNIAYRCDDIFSQVKKLN